MRLPKSSLFLLFASSSLGAQTLPEGFQSQTSNGHTIYGKAETLQNLSSVLPQAAQAAKQDFIILEPSRTDENDMDAFFDIPLIKNAFPAPKYETTSNKDPKFLSDMRRSMNRNLKALYETGKITFFASIYSQMAQFRNGENYLSYRFGNERKKVCIIMGDFNASASVVAPALGEISAKLLTDAFHEKFTDSKSLATLMLLHEAHHCTQPKLESNKVEDVLAYEIGADRAALVHYELLLSQGMKLDPDLPEKFAKLRLLAPNLISRGGFSSAMSGVMQSHSTASGLGNDNSVGDEIHQQSVTSTLIFKSLMYELAGEDARAAVRPEAERIIEATFGGLKNELAAAGKKEKNLKSRGDAAKMTEMMPELENILTQLIIADMVQNQNPELAYEAFQLIAADGWANNQGEDEGFIQSLAKRSIQAWQELGLKVPDVTVAQSETKLGLPEGQPLDRHILPLHRNIEQFRNKPAAPQPAG